ncbi:hypothetical protein KOR42_13670 [Thalassoglobus neptunius]|uniref:Uncharacterized protein n=1 Tax=Thalassoglobus neptunius TaxID=1938619 RepID=A0A5C5X5T9_9PLAN|nr:hypothetical protein KOR42_13670 [Thalassoglobus neptunius]
MLSPRAAEHSSIQRMINRTNVAAELFDSRACCGPIEIVNREASYDASGGVIPKSSIVSSD